MGHLVTPKLARFHSLCLTIGNFFTQLSTGSKHLLITESLCGGKTSPNVKWLSVIHSLWQPCSFIHLLCILLFNLYLSSGSQVSISPSVLLRTPNLMRCTGGTFFVIK